MLQWSKRHSLYWERLYYRAAIFLKLWMNHFNLIPDWIVNRKYKKLQSNNILPKLICDVLISYAGAHNQLRPNYRKISQTCFQNAWRVGVPCTFGDREFHKMGVIENNSFLYHIYLTRGRDWLSRFIGYRCIESPA